MCHNGVHNLLVHEITERLGREKIGIKQIACSFSDFRCTRLLSVLKVLLFRLRVVLFCGAKRYGFCPIFGDIFQFS